MGLTNKSYMFDGEVKNQAFEGDNGSRPAQAPYASLLRTLKPARCMHPAHLLLFRPIILHSTLLVHRKLRSLFVEATSYLRRKKQYYSCIEDPNLCILKRHLICAKEKQNTLA